MTTTTQDRQPTQTAAETLTKKDRIIALYLSGMHDVGDIAMMTATRASYVGSVLQKEGLLKDYFDVFTSTAHPMNAYSKFFAGRLKFKDEESARESVEWIDQLHRQFALARDRAGQHHALLMALTMFNRARWTGKEAEADIYRQWLAEQLQQAAPPAETQAVAKSKR